MTQVVGSEPFESRRIYSAAKGDLKLISKTVSSAKLQGFTGSKKISASEQGKVARRFLKDLGAQINGK